MIVVYTMFGRPGSGKTTLGKLLEEKNPEFIHISTGEIFRSIKKRGEDKDLIALMEIADKTRALYPDELTAEALETYILNRIKENKYNPLTQTIILDGFPRNMYQYRLMEGKYAILKAAWLDVPKEVCLDRIVNKRNLEEKRPEDSNIEVLKASIKEHDMNNSLIWTNLSNVTSQIYTCTRKIDGNRPIERVYRDLFAFFKD
jgi:adenylate kinase family enzyme